MWNDGLGCCVMPCHATAVSVPSGRFLSSPFHPLAPHWSLTALFSVPFPHHSFRSPPELSSCCFIIPAAIESDCRIPAPLGVCLPTSPMSDQELPALGTIRISGHWGANLQGPLLKGNVQMAVHKAEPLSVPPPRSEFPAPGIGFLSSPRAKSKDLLIGTLALAYI